jgi:hypothetical protein
MFHLNPNQQAKYRMGRKCAIEDQLSRRADLNDVTVPTILPSSFVGSAKWYHMLYLDALCLPHRFHAPDLFLTFTCNPQWSEIRAALPLGHDWKDHPDIVARVFFLKFKMMMKDIVQYEIFGPVQAFVWRIEWQARGLPHVHLLIILRYPCKSPREVDAVVCAEVPDPELFPELHSLVSELMIHQPCDSNEQAGCRQNNNKQCKRRFPKPMSSETVVLNNKYPKYRRRGRFSCQVGDRHVSDDWVVPYCPFLLLKYGAHCNVEIASSIKSFKYVYKYVLKSPDKASVIVNEIQAFLAGRLLSCSEAVWRFLGLPLHKEWPPVFRLQIHLPDAHTLLVDPTADPDDVAVSAASSTSTLLQWFELNRRDSEARSLLYAQVPEHYTWSASDKCWVKRQRGCGVGRILQVSSRNQELFALKRLLSIVKGATSWTCLLSVDGFCYDNFQAACAARGLMADDADIIAAFSEIASVSCSLAHMRREFANLLVHRSCQNATELFHVFAGELCSGGVVNPESCMEALWAIEDEMSTHGRSLQEADYGFRLTERAASQLPAPCFRKHVFSREECQSNMNDILPKFSDEQLEAQAVVLAALQGIGSNVVAIIAGAGCGKSLFVGGLTWQLRSVGRIVINVAASALAATLLPGGVTAHSAFRIPIPATESSFCGFKSSERELMKRCSCIFYDEVSMVSPEIANTLDRSLRDIMRTPELPFGGKVVVFLGDFKQLLPVVPSKKYVSTIKDCEWWPNCQVLTFTKNFRAVTNADYCTFLDAVGNGRVMQIAVPSESLASDEQDLIQRVYGDISTVAQTRNLIMAFTLESCKRINKACMAAMTAASWDAAAYDDAKDNKDPDCYTTEYLSELTLHGVPPAVLPMTVGARYMITKNYDISAGVCNGIFGQLLAASRNVAQVILHLHFASSPMTHFQVRLLSGPQKGRVALLPRCSHHVSCENSGLPFTFTRVQFPLSPGYCVSVHKSQGQSLDIVGLIADTDSFAHGQVYTALSRTSGWAKIHVIMKEKFLFNLVHKHVL